MFPVGNSKYGSVSDLAPVNVSLQTMFRAATVNRRISAEILTRRARGSVSEKLALLQQRFDPGQPASEVQVKFRSFAGTAHT